MLNEYPSSPEQMPSKESEDRAEQRPASLTPNPLLEANYFLFKPCQYKWQLNVSRQLMMIYKTKVEIKIDVDQRSSAQTKVEACTKAEFLFVRPKNDLPLTNRALCRQGIVDCPAWNRSPIKK